MVLTNGLTLALTGLGIGLVLSLPVARLMRGLLHGVTPGDPLTFVVVATALSAVALAASIMPALRATRVDPVIALKSE